MIRQAFLGALLAFAPFAATAQSHYPERPIQLVVGFPAGSSVDAAARLLAPKLSNALGKPIVIENVAGAAGNIASSRVAKAAPDGHTLALAANGQIIMNPSLYRLPFDPANDLQPVSQLVASPNLLVVPASSPVHTFQELIALAKAKPGLLTYASGGIGSSPHMAGSLLNSVAHVDIRHIPYKGVVAALPDLLAQRLNMMFSPLSIVLPAVRDTRLRALATTSSKRTSALPDIPTIAESGLPGFDVTVWFGLLAPAGTPAAIVRTLHHESVKILAMDDVRAQLSKLGMDVIGNSPEEFSTVIKSEIPFWAKIIKQANIKAD